MQFQEALTAGCKSISAFLTLCLVQMVTLHLPDAECVPGISGHLFLPARALVINFKVLQTFSQDF